MFRGEGWRLQLGTATGPRTSDLNIRRQNHINTQNMCHWIPRRNTGTSKVTSTFGDTTILIRLQIPIWIWIQNQYQFDFIQMVSLVLCRNTGTCVTPLSGDTNTNYRYKCKYIWNSTAKNIERINAKRKEYTNTNTIFNMYFLAEIKMVLLQNNWHLPADTLLWRHNNKTFSLRNRKRWSYHYQHHRHYHCWANFRSFVLLRQGHVPYIDCFLPWRHL